MQRHPTFMDQKTSCCWEGKTLPSGSTNSMPSYQHLRCLLIFTETDKMILKFMRKCKGPSIVKAIFKQKDKVRELTRLIFKTYNKNSVCQQKDREIGHWKRIKSPEINSNFYGKFIFNKGPRQFSGEIQRMVLGQLNICMKTNKVGLNLISRSNNSKWFIDLNLGSNII